MRKKFNPNHMPSGTLEMENLRNQIDRDSSSSDEGELDDDPTLSAGMCMALALKDDDVPRSWKQAVEIPHWLEAMVRDELEALGAWKSMPRLPGAKVLPGLWRFKVKHDEKVDITRYKARWYVDGSRGDTYGHLSRYTLRWQKSQL